MNVFDENAVYVIKKQCASIVTKAISLTLVVLGQMPQKVLDTLYITECAVQFQCI